MPQIRGLEITQRQYAQEQHDENLVVILETSFFTFYLVDESQLLVR